MGLSDYIINKVLNIPAPMLAGIGYWVILFTSILEATPVVGLFVPGQVFLMLGGFMARDGIIDLWLLLIVAAIGAFIGDLISYYLGKKYGDSLAKSLMGKIHIKEKHYQETKSLVKSHPGKTLLAARFTSFTRAFAPFAAGAAEVPVPKFLLFNIIGSVAWALTFTLIGFIFGESFQIAAKVFGKYVLIAIIVAILLIVAFRWINKKRKIFTRFHLYMLIINIMSLYIFSKMIDDVMRRELITKVDIWLNSSMQLVWNPILITIMKIITDVASTTVLSLLCLIFFVYLIYKKKYYNSILLAIAMMTGVAAELLSKFIIQRPRPENALVTFNTSSFPSGHATMAVVFFVTLAFIFREEIKNKMQRYIFILSCIIMAVLISFSRLYLNAHWLSDVIAGIALGLFIVTFYILLLTYIESLRESYKEKKEKREKS